MPLCAPLTCHYTVMPRNLLKLRCYGKREYITFIVGLSLVKRNNDFVNLRDEREDKLSLPLGIG